MLPEDPIKTTFGPLIRDYKYLFNQFSTELLSLKKTDNKEQEPYDLISKTWLDPDYYLSQATNMSLDKPKLSILAEQTLTGLYWTGLYWIILDTHLYSKFPTRL